MPLQPAYTWSENETSIRITVDNVPIKDKSQVFCSDRVVKLNASPYLLLLDLKHAVDDERSIATISRGRKVVLQLVKAQPGLWHQLTAAGDKESIKQQREESVQRAHQKLVAAQQQRLARKQQEEKAALDLQIAQEKAQRDQIETLKKQELQQERQELQHWQRQLPQSHSSGTAEALTQHQQGGSEESDYEDDLLEQVQPEDAECSLGNPAAGSPSSALAPTSSSAVAAPDHSEYHGRGWWPSRAATESSGAETTAPPEETSCGSSNATSQDGSSKSNSSCSSRMVNMQQLHASGNSEGIMAQLMSDAAALGSPSIQPHAPISDADHSNKEPLLVEISTSKPAGCRIKDAAMQQAGNVGICQESQASEHTAVKQQPRNCKAAKPRAPVRQATAPVAVKFTQLETPHLPAREQREIEIKQIRKASGKHEDSISVADRQPAFLKDKGDALAAKGNYRGAINAYTKALELDPSLSVLWSNRAAAHLALGNAAESVQDCSAAIERMQAMYARLQENPGPAVEQELKASMLPAMHSAARSGPQAAAGTAAAAAQYSLAENNAPAPSDTTSTDAASCPVEQHHAAQLRSTCPLDATDSPAVELTPQQQQQQFSTPPQQHSMADSLKQQLVKLFARRAAARVELQQLEAAQEDLQHALRLDPNNQALRADALEIALALNPDASTIVDSVRSWADARFRSGNLQTAAEAYTALLQLLEQQAVQHQQQLQQRQQRESAGDGEGEAAPVPQELQQTQQLVSALSNRAACWLGLNQYQDCVTDCRAALAAVMAYSISKSAALHTAADANNLLGSRCSSNSHRHDDPDDHTTQPWLELSPRQILFAAGQSLAKSAARVSGRMAAAYSCMKNVEAAEELYQWAEACWEALGEQTKAAALAADRAILRGVISAAATAGVSSSEGM